MALQNGRASSREDIVDSRHAIGASRRQLVSSLVEAGVEDFIVVPAELLDALARADVPKTRRSIDGPGEAIVTCEVELTA